MLLTRVPLEWESKSAEDEGYCWLCLYAKCYQQKMAALVGPYPPWGRLKMEGGFRPNASIRVHRRRYGALHLSSDGLGQPAEYLDIDANEIIGVSNNSINQGFYVPRNLDYVGAIWLAWAYLIVERIHEFSVIYLLVISVMLAFPTWCVEVVVLHTLTLPTLKFLTYLCKENMRNCVTTAKNCTIDSFARDNGRSTVVKFRRLAACSGWIFLLTMFTMPLKTHARYSLNVHSLTDILAQETEEDKFLIYQIHEEYKAVLEQSEVLHEMCTKDELVRHKILDLDVDDDVLTRYVEFMCPSIESTKWKAKAESHLRGKFSITDYVKAGQRLVEENVRSTLDTVAKVKTIADKGTERFSNLAITSVEETIYATADVLEGELPVAIDLGKRFVSAMLGMSRSFATVVVEKSENHTNAPEKIINHIAEQLYDPVDLIKKMTETTANLTKALGTGMPDAIALTERISNGIWNQTMNLVDAFATIINATTLVQTDLVSKASNGLSTAIQDAAVVVEKLYVGGRHHARDLYEDFPENELSIYRNLGNVIKDRSIAWEYLVSWYNSTEETIVTKVAFLMDSSRYGLKAGETIGSLFSGFVVGAKQAIPDPKTVKDWRIGLFGDWRDWHPFRNKRRWFKTKR